MIERNRDVGFVSGLLRRYPVVGLAGARQVGKTTLTRLVEQASGKTAVRFDLENPDDLKAYAVNHLEEEIRREALVRDWGAFLRFLRLAASESGNILNYAAVSREAGVSLPTVKSYSQLLEDMFVGLRADAFTKSPRKNLLSTPKFLLFDLGVRHAAAGLSPSLETVRANPGPVFEQWVGIVLWKRVNYLGGKLHYLRSSDGAGIDFIVESAGKLTPVEVKWTTHPSAKDTRHLKAFLAENVTAIPWERM